MRKKSSIVSHLIDHEKLELDKHIEEIVLANQSSTGGGGGGGLPLGGTTNQILTKNSDKDNDIGWNDPSSSYTDKQAQDAGIEVAPTPPSSPNIGKLYINSVDNKLYIYYGGVWQELHTLTPPAPPTPTFASLWFLMPNKST